MITQLLCRSYRARHSARPGAQHRAAEGPSQCWLTFEAVQGRPHETWQVRVLLQHTQTDDVIGPGV